MKNNYDGIIKVNFGLCCNTCNTAMELTNIKFTPFYEEHEWRCPKCGATISEHDYKHPITFYL